MHLILKFWITLVNNVLLLRNFQISVTTIILADLDHKFTFLEAASKYIECTNRYRFYLQLVFSHMYAFIHSFVFIFIFISVNMTDDVVNSWGVTSDTVVYLDSKLHIATYQTQLLTMEPVYLCNSVYNGDSAAYDDDGENNENQADEDADEDADANNNNNDADAAAACPSAGIYDFTDLPLQFPTVPNKVYDWAATGWTGSATIDMYIDENKGQLIGRCQFNVITHHSNSTSSNNNNRDSSMVDTVMKMVPEAKTTGMVIFGTLAALLFLCCAGSYLGGEFDDDDEDDDDDDMGFTRMDHGETA